MPVTGVQTCALMFIAGDCGGAINGQHIDIYFKTKTEAERFGVKGCPVKVIINEENIQSK